MGFVQDGKLDVLFALIMALVWFIRMIAFAKANESQVTLMKKYSKIEKTCEILVLALGVSAIIVALSVNGLRPISITNVIAVGVAIFISYIAIPKLARNQSEIASAITRLSSLPRYKIAETRHVENCDRIKDSGLVFTLAIEYMDRTSSEIDGPWEYIYYWNGSVYQRASDITLLVLNGSFESKLYNMPASVAHKIISSSDFSGQLLLISNLLAGMVHKDWFRTRFEVVVLIECWRDENTRYAVTSTRGIEYSIRVSIPDVDDRDQWVGQMRGKCPETIAIYLREGVFRERLDHMVNLMNQIQTEMLNVCRGGFNNYEHTATLVYENVKTQMGMVP